MGAHHFEVDLRYTLPRLFWEYGTMVLVIIEAPAVCFLEGERFRVYESHVSMRPRIPAQGYVNVTPDDYLFYWCLGRLRSAFNLSSFVAKTCISLHGLDNPMFPLSAYSFLRTATQKTTTV